MSGLENVCFLACSTRVQTLDVICNSLHPPAEAWRAGARITFPFRQSNRRLS